MGKKQKQKQQKSVKAPELPPEIPDEEIEVSDEDVQFVVSNRNYAKKFVSGLDTRSIDRHVSRIAGEQDDKLELSYEKHLKKLSLEKEEEKKGIQVNPVDALPIKTPDGQILYRTAPKSSSKPKNVGGEGEDEDEGEGDEGGHKSVVKLTKPEKRAKVKKSRKEAKKQTKETESQEPDSTPQAEALAEVNEELTAEEAAEEKKRKIAELGTALLSDPEANFKSLQTMLLFCKDNDKVIAKLGLLSCLAVFRDIIPGYRIRVLTEKELEMNVSKAVKKTRYFEFTLLSTYKAYLQRLLALEKDPLFHQIAVRCLCTLLDTVPHFNFRENILAAIVKYIGSLDDSTRTMCCSTIKSLFINEGKHGGQATVEAVRLISNVVKMHDCHLHPDSIEVFLSLSFDEELGNSEKGDEKTKHQKNKRRRKGDDKKQALIDDKKRSKKELLMKTRKEVNADFKAASFTQDIEERKRMQSQSLSALFNTYFRVLKHAVQPVTTSFQGPNNATGGAPGPYPLLASCLKGVGKFSHFIDLDFMADLMKILKTLSSGNTGPDGSEGHLTVSERLQCCMIAFKVMKNNLDALKVDLQDFFVQLYNLILEHKPDRDHGDVLAEALKVMLCDDRHHDMQRAAAFIKRLATSSLFFGTAESMAALVTVKQLLQKNVKCRNMLENDPGGGSVSGSIVKYQPYSSDPHMSGALASVLWELNLLSSHFHPAISTMASSILSMSAAPNQPFMSTMSPMQAFSNYSLEKEPLNPSIDGKKLNHKRKRGTSLPAGDGDATNLPDEECLKKKLSDHFILLRDIDENERLRLELNRTTLSLKLYDEYKKQRKPVQRPKQRK